MKQAFVTQLEELLNRDDINAVRGEVRELRGKYFTLAKEMRKELFEKYKAEGGNPDEYEAPPQDPLDEQFKGLLDAFHEKVLAYKKMLEEKEKTKLAEKKQLIEDMKQLAIDGNNVGKAFEDLRAFQDKWKAIGNVRLDEYKDVKIEYNHQIDVFYHELKIHKEFREFDQKRNLDAKLEVLDQIEAIKDMENIRDLDAEMKKLQQEWKAIGQVPFDDMTALNERYKSLTDGIYVRIQAYYDERREQMDGNLKAKIVLCERVNEVNSTEHSKLGDWQENTEAILQLQEEWKAIGFSTENEKIWQVFRGLCDTFFEKNANFLVI